jgi:hypothetical protein
MKLPELLKLAKDNKIRGAAQLNKPELIALLIEKGLIPDDVPSGKPKLSRKEYQKEYWEGCRKKRKVDDADDGKYDGLKTIRNNPKRVQILDQDTGETVEYSSMYKAAKAHGVNARLMSYYNGKEYKKRYKIKVCESTSGEEDLL